MFFGWVQGGGNLAAVGADVVASVMNSNCGGRSHAAVEVEREVVRWSAELLGLPSESSGVLTTGSSEANLLAALVAQSARPLGAVSYVARSAHSCMERACRVVKETHLCFVPTDSRGRTSVSGLSSLMNSYGRRGNKPAMVVATAGTVDAGMIDDLAGIGALAREHGAWFHVDAAFGAALACSDALRGRISGIELADSVAFDFHKWFQVQYSCGVFLTRHRGHHLKAFSTTPDYLARFEHGIAAGEVWPCDLGIALSRGFSALRVWTTLRAYGIDGIARVVERCCELARSLRELVLVDSRMRAQAEVDTCVACFWVDHDAYDDDVNSQVARNLQERGEAVISTTRVGGKTVMRACVMCHRTEQRHVEALAALVLAEVGRLAPSRARVPGQAAEGQ